MQLLITADYLKMPTLAKECVDFFAGHPREILQSHADMSALSSAVIKSLARRLDVKQIIHGRHWTSRQWRIATENCGQDCT